MSRINSPAELEEFRKNILSERDPNKPCITLCAGSACIATGSGDVALSLEAEIVKQGLRDKVELRTRAEITSHFAHLIFGSSSAAAQSLRPRNSSLLLRLHSIATTKSDPNLSVNSAKLFLSESLDEPAATVIVNGDP